MSNHVIAVFISVVPDYIGGEAVLIERIDLAKSRMIIDKRILDELTAQAKVSPRLRMNLDMRNSAEDQSQRMLNALEPGTALPIHRHHASSETVVILRGGSSGFSTTIMATRRNASLWMQMVICGC